MVFWNIGTKVCGSDRDYADKGSIAERGAVNDGDAGLCTVSWGDVNCDAEIVFNEGDSFSGAYDDAVGISCCSLN